MDIRTAYQIAWRYARLKLQLERLWEQVSYEEQLELQSVPVDERGEYADQLVGSGWMTQSEHDAHELKKRIEELIPVKPSDAMITTAQGCLFQRNYRPSWTPLQFGLWQNDQRRQVMEIERRRARRRARKG